MIILLPSDIVPQDRRSVFSKQHRLAYLEIGDSILKMICYVVSCVLQLTQGKSKQSTGNIHFRYTNETKK